jgi:hypothetical protein
VQWATLAEVAPLTTFAGNNHPASNGEMVCACVGLLKYKCASYFAWNSGRQTQKHKNLQIHV